MTLRQFMGRVIDDGIEAAKRDYKDGPKLEGAVAGFEDCRGKTGEELLALLHGAKCKMEANRTTLGTVVSLTEEQASAVWYWICYAAEVEWALNCLSAIMVNEGAAPLIPPTARGFIKAGEILGEAVSP